MRLKTSSMCFALAGTLGSLAGAAAAHPYDFAQATVLLDAELPNLQNRVAVIVRQDGREMVAEVVATIAMVEPRDFYAVTAVFGDHENLALIKDANTIHGPRCPVCAADYDSNGGVDGGDLAAFFTDFEQGSPCADVDQNGGVDGGDLGAFFAVFEAGGC